MMVFFGSNKIILLCLQDFVKIGCFATTIYQLFMFSLAYQHVIFHLFGQKTPKMF